MAMNIEEKIHCASDYVKKHEGTGTSETVRNDAANIFADNYEEYMSIWNAIQ